jgi:23S rRNA pseudouridine2605 synthase
MERLQKVIAASGLTSRRKAEDLITSGKVKVNGKVITELGTKVNSNDTIEVNNKILEQEAKEYYLLNKPRGVITSTSDDKDRKTVVDLINTSARIYPVGRLDYDTTGALLLTNDGEFANILMHPNSSVDKVYLAKLEGIIKGEQINMLKDGVMLDDVLVKASRVKLKKVNKESNTSLVEITIHTGLNHQVKRMFESVGYHVEKLTRKRIGIFDINNLQSGEYRKLTPKEVQIVYSYKGK